MAALNVGTYSFMSSTKVRSVELRNGDDEHQREHPVLSSTKVRSVELRNFHAERAEQLG